jgi:hypothetical protein
MSTKVTAVFTSMVVPAVMNTFAELLLSGAAKASEVNAGGKVMSFDTSQILAGAGEMSVQLPLAMLR